MLPLLAWVCELGSDPGAGGGRGAADLFGLLVGVRAPAVEVDLFLALASLRDRARDGTRGELRPSRPR